MAKRGAAVLIRYGRDMFLLLRDDKPDISFPLHWAVLAGVVEEGESDDQAIDRELREEVGTQVDEKEFIGHDSRGTAWYIATVSGQQVANIRRGEGCGHAFFSFEGLKSLARLEGRGGLGGAIKRFMQNAPDQIEKFLRYGPKPDLKRMDTEAMKWVK